MLFALVGMTIVAGGVTVKYVLSETTAHLK